jgi:hypothetical protein
LGKKMPQCGNLPYIKQVLEREDRFRSAEIGLAKGKKRNAAVQKSYSAFQLKTE